MMYVVVLSSLHCEQNRWDNELPRDRYGEIIPGLAELKGQAHFSFKSGIH